MTFNSQEVSVQTGMPVELYEFTYGPERFLYTDQDEDYLYLSKNYIATNISRDNFEESAELARNSLKIKVPRDSDIAELFRVYPPSEEVAITVYRIHRNDVDQEPVTLWVGRVLNATWNGPEAELHCENLFTSFKRKGLRRLYQKGCPHVLYGEECRVVKAAFKTVAIVTGVDGTIVTAPEIAAMPSTWFPGGIFEWEKSDNIWERRRIKSQSGDSITLAQPVYDLVANAQIDLYPGCAHDKTDCNGKFNNVLNYGGFTDIPQKNPFGQSGAF